MARNKGDLKEGRSYSCENCKFYAGNVKTKCAEGESGDYKYGAHFLCPCFKLKEKSDFSSADMLNNYFKKAGS